MGIPTCRNLVLSITGVGTGCDFINDTITLSSDDAHTWTGNGAKYDVVEVSCGTDYCWKLTIGNAIWSDCFNLFFEVPLDLVGCDPFELTGSGPNCPGPTCIENGDCGTCCDCFTVDFSIVVAP